jgi:transposase InsO family protein
MAELIETRGPWRDVDQVERAIFERITWCNGERSHSALDHVSPAEYEEVFWRSQANPHSPPEQSRFDSTKLGAAYG